MDTGNSGTENERLPNRDDYLWDGSGEPDPETLELEAILGSFRHDRPTPVFPEIVPERRWSFLPERMRLFPAFAAVAAIALVALL